MYRGEGGCQTKLELTWVDFVHKTWSFSGLSFPQFLYVFLLPSLHHVQSHLSFILPRHVQCIGLLKLLNNMCDLHIC